MEQIEVEAYNYQTKKQNLKIQFITFTDQLKFNKSEDFYKALFLIITSMVIVMFYLYESAIDTVLTNHKKFVNTENKFSRRQCYFCMRI